MVDLLFVPALRRYFDANVQELGPVCFYCGLRGHKAKDCTNQRKELPCALCAQYGHNKSHCPSCKSTATCSLTQVSCESETCVNAYSNNMHVSMHHPSLDFVMTDLQAVRLGSPSPFCKACILLLLHPLLMAVIGRSPAAL